MTTKTCWAFLFAICVASSLTGCGTAKDLIPDLKDPVPIRFHATLNRDDNLIADDYYYCYCWVENTSPRSVRGRAIVRAYGDVFGEGGRDGTGYEDNYHESEIKMFGPGMTDAFQCHHRVSNSRLKDNMSKSEYETIIKLRFEVEFIIDGEDEDYRSAEATFLVSNGAMTSK